MQQWARPLLGVECTSPLIFYLCMRMKVIVLVFPFPEDGHGMQVYKSRAELGFGLSAGGLQAPFWGQSERQTLLSPPPSPGGTVEGQGILREE